MKYVKITAASILIFVFLNLFIQSLASIITLKFDCTENRIFRLSDNTKQFLDTINEDITIYYLTDGGVEYPYVTQTLDCYLKQCKHLKLEKLDIIKNPVSVERFKSADSTLSKGMLVVESAERFKTVDPGSSLVIINEKGNVSQSLGFALEQKLTNAIDFVIKDKNPTVKYVSGHSGVNFELPAARLGDENIATEKIDLSDEAFSVDDTDLLVLFGLRDDLTSREEEAVRAYLDAGGAVYIAVNPGSDTPKIKALCSEYGITVNNDAVTEENASNIIKNNRLYILAQTVGDEFNELNTDGRQLLIPATSSLTLSKTQGCTVRSLAKSYETAKTRELLDDALDALGRGINTGETDLAAVSENTNNNSKLFVTATTQYLMPEDDALEGLLNSYTYINREFFVICIKQLIGGDGMSISIAPKSFMSRSLHLTSLTKTVLSTVFIAIPIAVLLFGIIYRLRRRKL